MPKNYQTSDQFKKRKNFNQSFGEPHFNFDEEVIRQLNLTGKEKILDVGCGYGVILRMLKKRGHKGRLAGIDQSAGMIAEAKKLSGRQSINWQVGLAEKLPFPNETFDVVVCKHALYHFNAPVAVKEMRRVLKKHGQLVISLNSYSRQSRVHIENYKKVLAKKLECSYPNTGAHVNFENYQKFVKGFRLLKEIYLCRYAKFLKPEPFLDYMTSFREAFTPAPSGARWQQALKTLNAVMAKEIKHKGSIEERLFAGMIILEKI